MTTAENHASTASMTTPQARFRAIDRVRIRYADNGSSAKPAVVLTSPWPENVDLPGFGASERREDLLSPRAMGEFLAQLNTAVGTIAGGIPDDIRADYLACYEGDRFVESMCPVRAGPAEPRPARTRPRRPHRGPLTTKGDAPCAPGSIQ